MKTLIAIPCMDTMPVGFVQSLLYLEKGNCSVLFKPNSLIYDARNLISLTAIENNIDRVLWLDSDMMFQPDTLKRLHADLDDASSIERPQMVTGLYFKRDGTGTPVIYRELDEPTTDENGNPVRHIQEYTYYPKDSVFTVNGCGFGCVLTSVKLLKKVWDKFGPAFAPFPWAGEDISFCYRVKQLGYDIWCDSRVKCGHIGTYVFTEDTFRKDDEH